MHPERVEHQARQLRLLATRLEDCGRHGAVPYALRTAADALSWQMDRPGDQSAARGFLAAVAAAKEACERAERTMRANGIPVRPQGE
jgi:hypothetical protein